MHLFEYPELALTQVVLIVIGGIWLLRRNDEIPLLISSVLFYVSSYRYWAVTSGFNRWVNLSSYGLTATTTETATQALQYIVLGQICLLITYMFYQRRVLPIAVTVGNYPLLRWLRPRVIGLGLFCLPLVIISRSNISTLVGSGKSLAFDISGYLQLFPLVLVGVSTLILFLWKCDGLPSLPSKVAALLILLSVTQLTFSASGRFQFLGWIAASSVILSASYKPKTRLIILAVSLLLCISLFSLAGAMRRPELAGDILNTAAWKRFFSAEDANMLDGFALLKDVYPQRLDFRWGMEHLEILMRPIPRALWPDKPVGGYMNRLGLTTHGGRGTLGFSPTLFGSFYAEGGVIAIIFLSVIYGAIFARIIRYSTNLYHAGILVRAILCASLVPLLRGGDLPGIYAWIGMAFWPCFLLLWIKRKDLKLQFYDPTQIQGLTHIPPVEHLE